MACIAAAIEALEKAITGRALETAGPAPQVCSDSQSALFEPHAERGAQAAGYLPNRSAQASGNLP
jgi:hypothetical protein